VENRFNGNELIGVYVFNKLRLPGQSSVIKLYVYLCGYIWKRSRLVWGRCTFRISTGTSVILTKVLCDFLRSFQANAGITSLRPWPLHPKSFPFHRSSYHQMICSLVTESDVKWIKRNTGPWSYVDDFHITGNRANHGSLIVHTDLYGKDVIHSWIIILFCICIWIIRLCPTPSSVNFLMTLSKLQSQPPLVNTMSHVKPPVGISMLLAGKVAWVMPRIALCCYLYSSFRLLLQTRCRHCHSVGERVTYYTTRLCVKLRKCDPWRPSPDMYESGSRGCLLRHYNLKSRNSATIELL
jgi:hypothetical protein